MTLTDHDLSELLAAIKAGDMTDKIRTSLDWVLQQLIEAEATAFIGAERHDRTDTSRRAAQREVERIPALAGAGFLVSCFFRSCGCRSWTVYSPIGGRRRQGLCGRVRAMVHWLLRFLP